MVRPIFGLLMLIVSFCLVNHAQAEVGRGESLNSPVDTLPPQLTIHTPQPNALYVAPAQALFSWSIEETNPDLQSPPPTAIVSIEDSVAFTHSFPSGQIDYQWSWQVPDLGPARGNLSISSTDAFGNSAQLQSPTFSIYPSSMAVQEMPPRTVSLEPARPNPFNPQTTIRMELPRDGSVTLEIFDLRGRRVRVLERGNLIAGPHEFLWNGTDDQQRSLAGGTYLVSLVFQNGSERLARTQKVVLLP